jgi:alpha-tubulin suppressor-like RCC1 family protein
MTTSTRPLCASLVVSVPTLYGQLGLGHLGPRSTDNRHVPIEVMALGTDNALVVGGAQHSLVLKTMGVVFAFGSGQYGMLGLGSTDNLFTCGVSTIVHPCQLSPIEVMALGTDNALVV